MMSSNVLYMHKNLHYSIVCETSYVASVMYDSITVNATMQVLMHNMGLTNVYVWL